MESTNIEDFRKEPIRRYYVDHGRGHDHLLRCKDCKSMVLSVDLFKDGCCTKCGSRKMTEIVALTFWEWLKVRVGYVNFEGRKEFLSEFRRS